MKILGIDPGSVTTGFGIVECSEKSYRFISCGCVHTSSKTPFTQRLGKIYSDLMDVIVELKPDEVAVEDVFYKDNPKTALKMGHARGVILLAAVNSNLPISEYTPREVKMAVVGSGRASKEQVQFMIMNVLGLRELPKPLDASDALAVALCHAHSLDSKFKVLNL